MVAQDGSSLSSFVGNQHRASGFGAAAGSIGMDLGSSKPGQFTGSFGKRGDVGAEADQSFLKARGQAAREESELLIEGEKARRRRPGRCRSVAVR